MALAASSERRVDVMRKTPGNYKRAIGRQKRPSASNRISPQISQMKQGLTNCPWSLANIHSSGTNHLRHPRTSVAKIPYLLT